jgi:GTP-binding protein
MAFIDEIKLHASAGRGGDGVVRWLHIKGNDFGGPAGGDGGRGGDVIIEGVRDLGALAAFRHVKKVKAEHGHAGDNNNKHGADGASVTLKVPVGTLVKNGTTKETFEVLEEGTQTVLFRGGQGGFGNPHFKASQNINPMESTPGKVGQSGDVYLTLKLIADAGFVGFPNAGKSSLLNSLTRARSKVAAYSFTTLDPHLGEFYGFVLADIPGLIEGASSGKGLGSRFLRHIERTALIIHLVSAEQADVAGAYKAIRKELELYGRDIAAKPEIVVLSKVDAVDEATLAKKSKELAEASGANVLHLSIIDEELLKSFSDYLSHYFTSVKNNANSDSV